MLELTLHLHDNLGLWAEQRQIVDGAGKAALFIDRDGVIVEETHYLCRPDDVCMIEGAAETIKWFNDRSLPVIMVTNQAGVGRGYFDWHDFVSVQNVIHAALAAEGACIDLVLACGFHADGIGAFKYENHLWRKPAPGMLEYACTQWDIDVSQSLIIGDNITDLLAGARFGLKHGVLVLTGHGKKHENALATIPGIMKCHVARSVSSALEVARNAGWVVN